MFVSMGVVRNHPNYCECRAMLLAVSGCHCPPSHSLHVTGFYVMKSLNASEAAAAPTLPRLSPWPSSVESVRKTTRPDHQVWHIEPGEHFVKHAVHCQAETEGAQLDPELSAGAGRPITDLIDILIHKGLYDDDYSGYLGIDDAGQLLPDVLAQHGIEAIDVCGFAENGCVAATVRDALAAGMPVRLITDLSSASSPEAALEVEKEFAEAGVGVITSEEAW
jgi:nicotinamidase/pyrazinamidase